MKKINFITLAAIVGLVVFATYIMRENQKLSEENQRLSSECNKLTIARNELAMDWQKVLNSNWDLSVDMFLYDKLIHKGASATGLPEDADTVKSWYSFHGGIDRKLRHFDGYLDKLYDKLISEGASVAGLPEIADTIRSRKGFQDFLFVRNAIRR